jgi:NAD-dependent SIR2 family protein deacetylase
VKLGLACNKCKGRLRPLRQPAQALREYTLRLFKCEECGKRCAVAWFIVNEHKARWLERIYEEHTEGL